MAAELGSSQISALLESVPGIANVLRSPVADAIVNLIRAAAGTQPFDPTDAEELVQYAVRRGLISADEGEQVLSEVKSRGRRGGGGAASKKAAARKKGKPTRRPVLKRPVKKKPTKRR
jgi:hypothetical protein